MLKFILQTTVGKKYWLLSLNMCNWKMLTIMMNSCGTFFYRLMTDVRKHVSQAREQKSRNVVACEQALCLGKGWKKTEPFPSLSSRFFNPFPKQRACLHASGNAAKFFCFLQRNVLPESKKARVRLSYGRRYWLPCIGFLNMRYARIFCWFPNILDQWEPKGNFPSTWAFSHAWVPSDKIKSKQQSRTPSVTLNFVEDCVP